MLCASVLLGSMGASGVHAQNTPALAGDEYEESEYPTGYVVDNGYEELEYYMPMTMAFDFEEEVVTSNIPTEYRNPYVTSVKNQGAYGTCWSFSICACAEANIMKKYGRKVDLSEWALAYNVGNANVPNRHGSTAGDSFTNKNGYLGATSAIVAIRALAGWRGFVLEEDAPYERVVADPYATLPDEVAYEKDAYHLAKVVRCEASDTDKIKELIMEYGACFSGIYYSASVSNVTDLANADGEVAIYSDMPRSVTHAITIVGWDDNFSRSNFGREDRGKIEPEYDGAWLVKNSFGTGNDNNGYFWLSYEDASMLVGRDCFFFEVVDAKEDYDNNYSYDGALTDTNIWCVGEANSFVADNNETLKAVGYFTAKDNYTCEIRVYKGSDWQQDELGLMTDDATLLFSQEIFEADTGYHIVTLDKEILLDRGERYVIVVNQKAIDVNDTVIGIETTKDGSWYSSVSFANDNDSFMKVVSNDGTLKWEEIGSRNMNCRIKAYTDNRSIDEEKDSEKEKGEGDENNVGKPAEIEKPFNSGKNPSKNTTEKITEKVTGEGRVTSSETDEQGITYGNGVFDKASIMIENVLKLAFKLCGVELVLHR